MAPTHEAFHHAIYECLKIVQLTTEVRGWKHSSKDVWHSLSKAPMKIKARNKNEVQKLTMKEVYFDINEFTEVMCDNAPSAGDDDEEEDSHKDVELPEGFYGNEGSDNKSE